VIEALKALCGAAAAYFGWRAKADPTPREREVQAAREIRDTADRQIDDWIDQQQQQNKPKP